MPRKAKLASLAQADAAPGGTASVDRALTVLSAFRTGDKALSLTEFAVRTQLHKSTVLRLLASLMHAGWIQRREDGGYELGLEVARLHGIFSSASSLDRIVMPRLQELVALTGEGASYHVKQPNGAGWNRLCLYRVDSSHTVRDHVQPGDLLPADRGVGARVLIAYSEPAVQGATEADRALYANIKSTGFCALIGDRSPDLAGISAPVFHADGRLAAAVTLTMPTHRYNPAYIPHVVAAAQRLTGMVYFNVSRTCLRT